MRICSPYFIRLLGEKGKPIIIRDADKTVHLLPQGTLSNFCRASHFISHFGSNVPFYEY